MDHTLVSALFGTTLMGLGVVVGVPGPREEASPLSIKGIPPSVEVRCEVARRGLAGVIERGDFSALRHWQPELQANCEAPSKP